MNPEQLIPIILATLSIGFSSFNKNKQWTMISFIVWLAIFAMTFILK